MFNNKLKKFGICTLSLLAVSTAAYAGGGYWQERKICEYETVTINEPVTYCSYSGSVYSDHPNVPGGRYATKTNKINGHITCPSEVYTSRTIKAEVDDGRWEFVRYEGSISLDNQSQSYDSRQENRVIENSCRIEKVWIPCDSRRGCNGEP